MRPYSPPVPSRRIFTSIQLENKVTLTFNRHRRRKAILPPLLFSDRVYPSAPVLSSNRGLTVEGLPPARPK